MVDSAYSKNSANSQTGFKPDNIPGVRLTRKSVFVSLKIMEGIIQICVEH